MLQITKIFRYEMAHAIHQYNGPCENIHGHSYLLEVTVESRLAHPGFIPPPGFDIDFKMLKKTVQEHILQNWDHALLLSEAYLSQYPHHRNNRNLFVFEAEPTAENMLIYIRREIKKYLPGLVQLKRLRLYETHDSYAEWVE